MISRTCECGSCDKCRHRAYMRDWNPERKRELSRAYYLANKDRWPARDPLKRKAQHAVFIEVRAGRLTKGACEVGVDCLGEIQAHHDDYSRPLDIRWLCRRHHRLVHTEVPA